MKTKSVFEGSGCALVTPFGEDSHTDYEALGRLVDFQTENGTDAIIACGTTGEASTLSDEEQLDVIEYVVKRVNGKIPVIAGAGSNDTAHAVMLSQEAQKRGADALLSVTPYYNKASQRGLVKHFSAIADSVDIPCILYNVPSRTGLNISTDTLEALAQHPNIVGIKEASGNMAQVASMMARCGNALDFYSGCDEINVPLMSLGGKGAISVLANVAPKKTHDMLAFALNGNYAEAAKLQLESNEMIAALFCEVNPIPVKTALSFMGFCEDRLHLPLCEASPESAQRIKNAMREYGLIG